MMNYQKVVVQLQGIVSGDNNDMCHYIHVSIDSLIINKLTSYLSVVISRATQYRSPMSGSTLMYLSSGNWGKSDLAI